MTADERAAALAEIRAKLDSIPDGLGEDDDPPLWGDNLVSFVALAAFVVAYLVLTTKMEIPDSFFLFAGSFFIYGLIASRLIHWTWTKFSRRRGG